MNRRHQMWMATGALALVLASGVLRAAPAGAEAESGEMPYRIGIEDRLRVVVWGEPDITGTYAVRPDGKITVPLVNDIHVVGLTTDQVRERIAERLAGYIQSPNVTVIADQINSYRVYFLGKIGTQGAIQLYSRTRLLQAIAMAGGLTEFAKKELTLIRQQDGSEKRFRVDYKRLISGDPAQENLILQPGDTVIFH